MCNIKLTELVIGIIVLILAMFPDLLGAGISSWIIAIAAAVLIIHALTFKLMSKEHKPVKEVKKKR